MSGGRNRYTPRIAPETRKPVLLGADERAEAMRLRRQRFSVAAIARAIGRSVPDVAEFLASPEGRLEP